MEYKTSISCAGLVKRVLTLVFVLFFMLNVSACEKQIEENQKNLETVVSNTADMLLKSVSEPVYGSICGDWIAFGLARWGGEVPEAWYDALCKTLYTR